MARMTQQCTNCPVYGTWKYFVDKMRLRVGDDTLDLSWRAKFGPPPPGLTSQARHFYSGLAALATMNVPHWSNTWSSCLRAIPPCFIIVTRAYISPASGARPQQSKLQSAPYPSSSRAPSPLLCFLVSIIDPCPATPAASPATPHFHSPLHHREAICWLLASFTVLNPSVPPSLWF